MTKPTDINDRPEKEFNRLFFLFVAWCYRQIIQVLALVTNKQISCKSLNGYGTWDTAIASDMRVHCNCMDFYGHGILGNLRENTLSEIWHGRTAVKFRKKLKHGIFPIAECAKCSAWTLIPKDQEVRVKLPDTVMVENTYKCNYACTSCHRTPLTQTRKETRLNENDIELIANTISENNITKVVYHVLGEPFLVNDIDEQLAVIRKKNPDIHIFLTTNGSLLNTEKKRFATTLINNLEFSLDGVDNNSVQKYQVGGDFDTPFKNLKDLVEYSKKNNSRTLIGWRYVMFRWNNRPEQIQKAYELAKKAGVSYILFRPTNTPISGISLRSWYYQLVGLPLPQARGIKKEDIGFKVEIKA